MSYESPAKHLLKIISDNHNAPTPRKRDAGSSLISALHSHIANGDIAIVDLKEHKPLSSFLTTEIVGTREEKNPYLDYEEPEPWEKRAGNKFYVSMFDVKKPDSTCPLRFKGKCLHPEQVKIKLNDVAGYVMDRENPDDKQYNGPYHRDCAIMVCAKMQAKYDSGE
jgi:hypothetical protein